MDVWLIWRSLFKRMYCCVTWVGLSRVYEEMGVEWRARRRTSSIGMATTAFKLLKAPWAESNVTLLGGEAVTADCGSVESFGADDGLKPPRGVVENLMK